MGSRHEILEARPTAQGASAHSQSVINAIRIAAAIAVVFGLLTILSGGRALFGATDMCAIFGFVLAVNFLAGFAYVLAGGGLWQGRDWAPGLSFAILAATLIVFAACGWHVLSGGPWETRTLGAMTLRSLVWMVIAATAQHRNSR